MWLLIHQPFFRLTFNSQLSVWNKPRLVTQITSEIFNAKTTSVWNSYKRSRTFARELIGNVTAAIANYQYNKECFSASLHKLPVSLKIDSNIFDRMAPLVRSKPRAFDLVRTLKIYFEVVHRIVVPQVGANNTFDFRLMETSLSTFVATGLRKSLKREASTVFWRKRHRR